MKGMEQPSSIENLATKTAVSKVLRKNKKIPEFWAISPEDEARLVRVR